MSHREWQRQQQEDLQGPQALGEDLDKPLESKSVPSNPAVRLAYSFEDGWTKALTRWPEWKQHRCMHQGPAIGYLTSQFLRKGYSPEHVEAYFEAFFDELTDSTSSLQVKDGQTPWMLFTGWWGSCSIPDPAIARAKAEESAALQAEGARLGAIAGAKVEAARERVFAAMDAGVFADPQDYQDMGIPVPRELLRQLRRRSA